MPSTPSSPDSPWPTQASAHRPAGPGLGWDERIRRADSLSAPCELCLVRCGVNRPAGARGRCGLADSTPVYGTMLTFGEERALSPSCLVLLSGCSMHCTFCSEDGYLRPPFSGATLGPVELAETIGGVLRGSKAAARSINFVGGEPAISLPYVLRAARALESLVVAHPPLVLNTNGTLTEQALALCEHVFDVLLFDLKFGPSGPGRAVDCGRSIGKIDGYFEHLSARLRQARDMASRPQLFVRHLLMPGHLACCTAPVLDWLSHELPDATVNLMTGFTVFANTRAARHWTSLSPREEARAIEMYAASGLRNRLLNGGPFVA